MSVTTSNTVAFTVSAASSVPAYAQGLADYEVLSLSSVANGNPTIYAASPTEWRGTENAGEVGLPSVIGAWSGGSGDGAGRRLFVHGGGHSDSANNGLYVFDFDGTTLATGWTVVGQSARSAVRKDNVTYTDGRPSAVHTYDQVRYDPVNNRFYRASGSYYGDTGAWSGYCGYYDLTSNAWVSLVTNNGYVLGSTALISPDGTQMLVLGLQTTPVFINTTSGATTTASISGSWTTSQEECFVFAMDSARSTFDSNGICKYVGFGASSSASGAWVLSVNWTSKTLTAGSRATLSGAGAGYFDAQAPSVIYDALKDRFWCFGVRDQVEGTNPTTIIEVNADTFACTSHNLSGDTLTSQAYNRGSYGRCVWISDWRMIGTVQAYNQPAALIKLPD